jgi:choline-sulfatase
MERPDILIFLSDQHNALYSGYAGHSIIQTPNIDALARQGTCFDAAYTSCPLCVPARLSFLTSQANWKSGMFTNACSLPEDEVTFLHNLALAGYETVLCGRMHFKGHNQRHGFTRRLFGDFTPAFWSNTAWETHLGPYAETVAAKHCLSVRGGGGISPVLAYDKAVVQAALRYLLQEHDRPQCLVVGTYGPHFPYAAPAEWYQYYREVVDRPRASGALDRQNEFILKRQQPVADEIMLQARASYYGMISTLDAQVGQVWNAWEQHLQNSGRAGLFVYTSDHGDTAGERQLYGKLSLFEGSARIPLIVAGEGVQENCRISSPASMLDLAPTLCDLGGADVLSEADGKSLRPQIMDGKNEPERYVLSEIIDRADDGAPVPSRMIRQGEWKLICYYGRDDYDMLFQLADDPYELNNCVRDYPEKARELKNVLSKDWDIEAISSTYRAKAHQHQVLRRLHEIHEPALPQKEVWTGYQHTVRLPDIL